MSVHGYKVDNPALQRALDNLTSRQINALANAGIKAMDDISRKTIEMFYQSRTPKNSHEYSSLMYSLKVKKNPPRQDSRYVWVDIDMYIDESAFLYATEDFYSIYDWADRESSDKKKKTRMTHPEAASFVIGLQWEEGVIGLPDTGVKGKWPHLSSTPLEKLLEDELKRIWTKRVRKFL